MTYGAPHYRRILAICPVFFLVLGTSILFVTPWVCDLSSTRPSARISIQPQLWNIAIRPSFKLTRDFHLVVRQPHQYRTSRSSLSNTCCFARSNAHLYTPPEGTAVISNDGYKARRINKSETHCKPVYRRRWPLRHTRIAFNWNWCSANIALIDETIEVSHREAGFIWEFMGRKQGPQGLAACSRKVKQSYRHISSVRVSVIIFIS
jgi:hypothetical protein